MEGKRNLQEHLNTKSSVQNRINTVQQDQKVDKCKFGLKDFSRFKSYFKLFLFLTSFNLITPPFMAKIMRIKMTHSTFMGSGWLS